MRLALRPPDAPRCWWACSWSQWRPVSGWRGSPTRSGRPGGAAGDRAGRRAWYALTALRFRPILVWGLSRTFGSARRPLPDISRALPLLLLAIVPVHQHRDVAGRVQLTVGTLWLVVLLFAALGVGLLSGPAARGGRPAPTTTSTPPWCCARAPVRRLRRLPGAGRGPRCRPGPVRRGDRFRSAGTSILVLMVIQLVQVLLPAVGVFGFLVPSAR